MALVSLVYLSIAALPLRSSGTPLVQDNDDLSSLVQLDLVTRLDRAHNSTAEATARSRAGTARGTDNVSSEARNASSERDLGQVRVPGEPVALLADAKEAKVEVDWAKPPQPDLALGFRQKLDTVGPKFVGSCHDRDFGTEEECQNASALLRTMMDLSPQASEDPLLRKTAAGMLDLGYFLWAPGPPRSFIDADTDHSGNLSWPEVEAILGPEEVKSMSTVRSFLDANEDGAITKDELHDFLRLGILIRDVLPEVDMLNPRASTKEALQQLRRIYFVPNLPKYMSRPLKIGLLLAILFVGLILMWFNCSGKPVATK